MLSQFALFDLLLPLILAALCGTLVAWLWMRPVRSRPRRIAAYVFLLCGMVEFGVFRNPLFFVAGLRFTTVDDVGFKQRGMMSLEIMRRQRPWNAPFLAVGSSQVGAVFSPYARHHPEIRVLALAGMSPMEMYWYRDLVARHASGTVILYLSELDLSRHATVESFKMSPWRNPVALVDLSCMLRRTGGVSASDIAELWISNTLSPYRYQFILRGLLKQAAEVARAFPDEQISHGLQQDSAVREQIEGISNPDDHWFAENLAATERFMQWCDARALSVIVVQGHYHPVAVARQLQLRAKARTVLMELCARHDNVRFVGEEEIGVPALEDYQDGTHVSPEAGARFAEALMNRLQLAGGAKLVGR